MALTGVLITWLWASRGLPFGKGSDLEGDADGSEMMPSPGVSNTSAPTERGIGLKPILTIAASAPIFYATGRSPDATNGPRRYFDPSRGNKQIFVNGGDKVAWIYA